MDRRSFLKTAGATIAASSVTAGILERVWRAINEEQAILAEKQLRGDTIQVTYVIGNNGYIHSLFDSEKTRELIAKAGYLVCDGRAVSKAQYPELYELIGDQFGNSRLGREFFCLPDLRARIKRV